MFTTLLSFDSLWLEDIDWHPMGVMLEIFIFIYSFCALACVCDTYLILSLETFCVRWNIREDVAGATILALGSAAPELIIASVNTVGGESDLGVGAIIGSGMLAFSVLPGLMALVAGSDLMLKRRPLARDSITYLIAFIALTIFIADGFIELWESAILFSMYIVYVIVVVASPTVREKMIMRERQNEYAIKVREAIAMGADRTTLQELKTKYLTVTERKSFVHQKKEEQQLAVLKASSNDRSEMTSSFLSQDEQKQSASDANELEAPSMNDDNGPTVYEVEDVIRHEGPSMSMKARAWRLFTWPLQRAFDLTCINCEHDSPNAKYYPATFIVAFLWVSVFSFLISVISGRFNVISGLPLSLFGIILVAVGAEVPDGVQSLSVAKRGYGSMAVSNSCGAQITNVLVGLGLPWFIANIVGVGEGTREGFNQCAHSFDPNCKPNPELVNGHVPWKGIQIREHEDLSIAAAFQFVNLGLFICILLLSAIFKRQAKAVLSKPKGKIMMGFYLVVVLGYCITSQVLVKPTPDPQYYAPLD